MAAFHVFVEGPTDNSPTGVAQLAEAIGTHYGIPAADLQTRLLKGRVRVKANTDRETADLYARDLDRLGAICTIEEANADNSQRTTPLPFPVARPATPPAGTPAVRPPPTGSALASAPPSRPSAPPSALSGMAPSRASTPPSGMAQYQSGLSAAFSNETSAANLGALEGEGLAFSLAAVDGKDESGGAPADSFEPPADGALPASIGPAPEKPKATAAKTGKPKDEPLDLFAPPDAEDAKFKVDIASDEIETSARKRASTPPPVEAAATQQPSQPLMRKSQPIMTPVGGVAVASAPSSKLGPLGDERVRFVAGIVLALGLGFLPAHMVAGMREDSAYEEIDRKVVRAQQAAETPESYALLDKMRADQLDRKEAERRNAALIAIFVWGLVASGIAFAWFKKIPWDSFE